MGATRKEIAFRFRQHRYVAKNVTVDRPLYRWLHDHMNDAYVVLIKECANEEEMSLVEEQEIASRVNLFNNMTGGMKGTRHNDATRAKMREAAKTKVRTPEHNAKIGAANRGRVHTAESRAKASAARKAWWAAKRAADARENE